MAKGKRELFENISTIHVPFQMSYISGAWEFEIDQATSVNTMVHYIYFPNICGRKWARSPDKNELAQEVSFANVKCPCLLACSSGFFFLETGFVFIYFS
jgi:hypothetical protein